jgi:uncharacterized membrane protein
MNADRDAEGPPLERWVGLVLRIGVMASSACLTIGLVLVLISGGEGGAAGILLRAGIIVLLATPVARVVVSTVQYVIVRDWTFAVLTTIVLVELMASVVATFFLNRRI